MIVFPIEERFLFEEFKQLFGGQTGCVVIPSIHNPYFYDLYVIVIAILQKHSQDFVVCFVNEHHLNCKLCQRLSKTRSKVMNWLEERNIPYESFLRNDEIIREIPIVTPKKFRSQLEELSQIQKNSILSYFATSKLQSDSLKSLPLRYYGKFRDLKRQFQYAHEVLEKCEYRFRSVFSRKRFEFIVSLNGRYPFQSGIRNYCEVRHIRYVSLEHGQLHGLNMHLSDFQPQEIRKLDEWINHRLSKAKEKDRQHVAEVGKSWLCKQESDIKQNIFLTPSTHENYGDAKGNILLCTSSLDERFSNLGVDLNNWRSQFEAYNSVIKFSLDSSINVTLKIHPNSLNKAIVDLWRLYRQINSTHAIRIVSPWSKLNVFELIDQHEYFATWGSSLAISAAARGKKCFLLGPTNFMSTLKVPLISPEKITNLALHELETVDQTRVLMAAGVIRNWGYDVKSLRNSSRNYGYDEEIAAFNFKEEISSAYFPILRERLLRRVGIMKAITKGRYVTPNEIVDFLVKIFFVPDRIAFYFVQTSFLTLLRIRQILDIR